MHGGITTLSLLPVIFISFKNVRPGITIGVIAGREQVEKYMSGAWWNNDPVIAARNIHISWGDIQNDG
ncbi:hypothetical protein BFD61_23675 [Escherichia coli]|nr:hypothetical protein BFD61_23675 [Escherichia coli]